MYGRVLGITSLTLLDGQNLNFAYACHYVQQLLPRKLITYLDWWELEQFEAMAKEENYAAQPLFGLKGVAIRVADVDSDAKAEGLDTGKLKATID